MSSMSYTPTPSGSPQNALLQQQALRGQGMAQLHPLSIQRPVLGAGPANGLMTQHPISFQGGQNQKSQAQLLSLLMGLRQFGNQGKQQVPNYSIGLPGQGVPGQSGGNYGAAITDPRQALIHLLTLGSGGTR